MDQWKYGHASSQEKIPSAAIQNHHITNNNTISTILNEKRTKVILIPSSNETSNHTDEPYIQCMPSQILNK